MRKRFSIDRLSLFCINPLAKTHMQLAYLFSPALLALWQEVRALRLLVVTYGLGSVYGGKISAFIKQSLISLWQTHKDNHSNVKSSVTCGIYHRCQSSIKQRIWQLCELNTHDDSPRSALAIPKACKIDLDFFSNAMLGIVAYLFANFTMACPLSLGGFFYHQLSYKHVRYGLSRRMRW